MLIKLITMFIFLGFVDGYYFIAVDQDSIRTQRKTHITQFIINIPNIFENLLYS